MHHGWLTFLFALSAWFAGARAVAQQAEAWLWQPLPDAASTAVGLVWAHGYDDDPADAVGLARVLAECRLARARAAAGVVTSGLLVGDDFALVFVVVRGDRVAAAAAFVAAALDDRAEWRDDDVTSIVARVALAADDDEFIYPGPVLASLARRALATGTPAARPVSGDARAIAALRPDDVRRWLREPVAVRGAALGHVDDALRTALTALPWPAVAWPTRPVRVLAPQGATAQLPAATNGRTDAPYVAAAFAAPAPADRAAFAVACEVANGRARRAFRSRGQEAVARAPFVAWSWLRAEPIAMFYRRGEDPVKLWPGQHAEADARAEAAATTVDLRAFLVDLVGTPPTAAEVATAVEVLDSQCGLPTTAADDPDGMLAPGWLQNLLLAACHGIDRSGLATVDPARVTAIAAQCLDPERALWLVALPEPRTGFGFRRR